MKSGQVSGEAGAESAFRGPQNVQRVTDVRLVFSRHGKWGDCLCTCSLSVSVMVFLTRLTAVVALLSWRGKNG